MTLVLVWIMLGLAQGPGWREALASEDYVKAWELSGDETDALSNSLARAEIFYRAGDPVRALDAAEEGLRLDPEHLALLYRATASALWLEDSFLASEYSLRLEKCVSSAPTLRDVEREEWTKAAADLRAGSIELDQHVEEMRRALFVAKGIAFGGLALALLVSAVLGGYGYGRSSRPVS